MPFIVALFALGAALASGSFTASVLAIAAAVLPIALVLARVLLPFAIAAAFAIALTPFAMLPLTVRPP